MTTAAEAPPRAGLLHIGAVCRRLREEFPDVSISKIRYLEDQGLLAPERTQGGYRLFDEDAVERLRTILRMQRDQFLPLRVIRQELASPTAGKQRRRRCCLPVVGEASSCRITRSGRNWSRCKRRIVRRRSTASSSKSR